MKRKKQKSYRTTTSTDVEYMKVVKIALGVLLILGIVYFVTAMSMGEIKLKKNEKVKTETSIQYEEIIAGSIFNRNADNYYVLLFNFTDQYASYYLSLIDSYKGKDGSLPFYIVDLEKKVNSNYAIKEDDDNTYPTPKDISNLKVSNPTILKIQKTKVVDVIAGQDKVLEFFEK